MPPTSTTTGTRAVDRAASLLVAVLDAREPVPFPELVLGTGLPKSTVSRLLSSLERSGLIARTADGDVAPGPAVLSFATSHRPTERLRSLARPALESLGRATGETINLAVPTPSGVVQIDQVDPRFHLGAANWLDQEVPFHCSAVGKALLAAGHPLPEGRLERITDRTPTTRVDLDAHLARARAVGYAVADGELEQGLVAVAAAVIVDGRPVAALSVSGPEARLTDEQVRRVGGMLVTEARALSALLQSRPGLTPPGKAGAA